MANGKKRKHNTIINNKNKNNNNNNNKSIRTLNGSNEINLSEKMVLGFDYNTNNLENINKENSNKENRNENQDTMKFKKRKTKNTLFIPIVESGKQLANSKNGIYTFKKRVFSDKTRKIRK